MTDIRYLRKNMYELRLGVCDYYILTVYCYY